MRVRGCEGERSEVTSRRREGGRRVAVSSSEASADTQTRGKVAFSLVLLGIGIHLHVSTLLNVEDLETGYHCMYHCSGCMAHLWSLQVRCWLHETYSLAQPLGPNQTLTCPFALALAQAWYSRQSRNQTLEQRESGSETTLDTA